MPPNGKVTDWFRWATGIFAIPLISAVLIFVIITERRVTTIEANRFTSIDALEFYEKLHAKADKKDVPPPVVEVRLDHLEQAVERIEANQAEILRRLP